MGTPGSVDPGTLSGRVNGVVMNRQLYRPSPVKLRPLRPSDATPELSRIVRQKQSGADFATRLTAAREGTAQRIRKRMQPCFHQISRAASRRACDSSCERKDYEDRRCCGFLTGANRGLGLSRNRRSKEGCGRFMRARAIRPACDLPGVVPVIGPDSPFPRLDLDLSCRLSRTLGALRVVSSGNELAAAFIPFAVGAGLAARLGSTLSAHALAASTSSRSGQNPR